MFNLLKKIVALIVISVICSMPPVFAQQISFAPPAEQISVSITISSEGDIQVVHLVKKSNNVKQVDTISGTITNLKVSDVNGNEIQHAVIGGNFGVTIFPTDENIIVEYDLSDALFLDENVWKWDFFYPVSSQFYFPEEVDFVFANDRPIPLKDVKGMNCHGCDMMLEYIIEEPVIFKEVTWETKKFPVLIRTLDEINSFSFDQPSRSISFETNEGNQFITLAIPLELLWNPYVVYFNDEKIPKHEFSKNDTHIWLNIKPESAGKVKIIGTSVVPEFPIMVPLFLGIVIVIGLQFRNKINLR